MQDIYQHAITMPIISMYNSGIIIANAITMPIHVV